MSRAQLTSTVEQNTGGAVSPYVAGKNKIINGDFNVWQRGISLNLGYGLTRCSDKWYTNSDSSLTGTSSRQPFTAGSAPVAGYEFAYFMHQNITGVSGGSFIVIAGQDIEDVRTLAGQTATFSFWAKADTTRTYSVGFQQQFGTGGSSPVYGTGVNVIVGTTWARYTANIPFPSLAGKTVGTNSYLTFYILATTITAQTLDLAGFQLEAGSVATPFTTATGTLSGELQACQRYYWRNSSTSNAFFINPIQGSSYNATTACDLGIQAPVQMRVAPTAFEYSNICVTDGTNIYSGGTWAFNAANSPFIQGVRYTNGTNFPAPYRPVSIGNTTNAATYFGFSAEL